MASIKYPLIPVICLVCSLAVTDTPVAETITPDQLPPESAGPTGVDFYETAVEACRDGDSVCIELAKIGAVNSCGGNSDCISAIEVRHRLEYPKRQLEEQWHDKAEQATNSLRIPDPPEE